MVITTVFLLLIIYKLTIDIILLIILFMCDHITVYIYSMYLLKI